MKAPNAFLASERCASDRVPSRELLDLVYERWLAECIMWTTCSWTEKIVRGGGRLGCRGNALAPPAAAARFPLSSTEPKFQPCRFPGYQLFSFLKERRQPGSVDVKRTGLSTLPNPNYLAVVPGERLKNKTSIFSLKRLHFRQWQMLVLERAGSVVSLKHWYPALLLFDGLMCCCCFEIFSKNGASLLKKFKNNNT